MDTCHAFNLNVDPPADTRNQDSDPPNLHSDHQETTNLQPQLQLTLHCIHEKTEQSGNLMEMMSRIEMDNTKIIKSLADLVHKYDVMHHQLIDLIKPKTEEEDDDDDDDGQNNKLGKKRKAAELSTDEGVHSCVSEGSCCRRARLINYKPKISTAFIPIDQSDTSLVVKDGYQWRKYGQKVTRDNPSPRAYYKCSFAPLCSMKKKVQRSAEDATVLVVTYEGEHNHKKPASGPTLSPPSSLIQAEDDVTGDVFQPRLVEEMASALTKQPSFTSALASAIYSQLLHHKSF